LQLPARALGLGDDLAVVGWVGAGEDPSAPGHAPGELQVGGVAEVHVARRPVEGERTAVLATGRPGGAALQRAGVALARGVGGGRAAALAEGVRRHKTGRTGLERRDIARVDIRHDDLMALRPAVAP